LKLNGLCAFQDQNCLTFSPISPGVCQLCKPEYFYNSQLEICILLPPYCTSLDISGRCNQCNSMYVLTSGYQCIYLSVRVPNCKMVNQADYSKCSMCIDGFFADNSGECQVLPLFCSQFDANTNTCVQCSSNGVMKNGLCVDKNCLIFDT
jgi:phage FluMu protein Com